ncbi:MAG: beta-hydroxyacyl-ACP dehydratase [Gemmatimonadota bacterium]|nr:beta-hydroxyacyl-ACP dehydratase [Gemmatimonadota bacterium]
MDSDVALPSVLELLPHRYPFLLVDRILAIDPGRSAVGVRRVTADEWFTGKAAHYEMPNTLILEALAQLSGAVLVGLVEGAQGAVGYFVGMQRVKFRGRARAGDELKLECTLLQFKRGICKTAAVASIEGRRIVRAQLTTVLRTA